MTTCPRPVPTIDRALRGLEDVIIHADPEKEGALQAVDKALRSCIAAGRKYCLVIPDDVILVDGWREVVAEIMKQPKVGYFALYTPKGLAQRYGFKGGVNEITGGWANSWGGCYVIPTNVAKRVVANQFYQDHLHGRLSGKGLFNYAKGKRIDHVIPEVIHQLGLRQLYHAPSLCVHIGITSTLGHRHTINEEPFELWEKEKKAE